MAGIAKRHGAGRLERGDLDMTTARLAHYPIALLMAMALAVALPGAPRAQDAMLQNLKLVEFTPWLTTKKGPQQSKGVIYFIRGWGGAVNGGGSIDEFQLIPYFIKTLADNGWDVIGAKFPNTPTKIRSAEYVPAAVRYVDQRVKELKKEGYKKVIVGGHSWGGWVAMAAAKAGSGVDAVLAMAPDAYGPKIVFGGMTNPRFPLNEK